MLPWEGAVRRTTLNANGVYLHTSQTSSARRERIDCYCLVARLAARRERRCRPYTGEIPANAPREGGERWARVRGSPHPPPSPSPSPSDDATSPMMPPPPRDAALSRLTPPPRARPTPPRRSGCHLLRPVVKLRAFLGLSMLIGLIYKSVIMTRVRVLKTIIGKEDKCLLEEMDLFRDWEERCGSEDCKIRQQRRR
ncbi:uncharacterized protein [Miscanthus floridulus]|uniref:uncharacterized protein n=1 Tax=Miscanthus floridulus TaxID=154761 RepID=UPI003457F419